MTEFSVQIVLIFTECELVARLEAPVFVRSLLDGVVCQVNQFVGQVIVDKSST